MDLLDLWIDLSTSTSKFWSASLLRSVKSTEPSQVYCVAQNPQFFPTWALVYKGEVSPNISLGQHITKIQGLVKSVNSWSEINNINSDGLDRTSSPGYIIKNNHQHCTKITDDGLKWLETCLIVLNWQTYKQFVPNHYYYFQAYTASCITQPLSWLHNNSLDMLESQIHKC